MTLTVFLPRNPKHCAFAGSFAVRLCMESKKVLQGKFNYIIINDIVVIVLGVITTFSICCRNKDL